MLGDSTKNDELIVSLKSGEAHSFEIVAEKPVSNKNEHSDKNSPRIDIFIGWKKSDDKEAFGLLIEAKFKHCVTEGQLEPYEKYAKNVFGNKSKTALCLLTLDGKSEPNWQPMQWLTLMSRWERSLNDDDTDFIQFRRFIWTKIGT